MRRDRWRGIVGFATTCRHRPGAGARGDVQAAEGNVMISSRLCHEAVDHRDPVHEWRAGQLTRLGIPWSLAEAVADHVDWHQVASLVQRGCPPRLALAIVR